MASYRAREAETMKRRKKLRLRFRNMVRSVVFNRKWLMEMEDRKLSLNVSKNIAMLVRAPQRKIGLLTLADKSIIRTSHEFRSVEDRRHLVKLIAGLECFSTVPPKVRARLVPVIRFMFLDPGHILIREGDPPSMVYFILSGEVEVSRKVFDFVEKKFVDVIETIYGPGDTIGDVEFFEHCRRKHTVISKTDVEVLMLFKDEFNKIMKPYLSKIWEAKKLAMKAVGYFDFFSYDQVLRACKQGVLRQFEPLETIYYKDQGHLSYVYFVLSGECTILQCLKMKVTTRDKTKTFELLDIKFSDLSKLAEQAESSKKMMHESTSVLNFDSPDLSSLESRRKSFSSVQSNLRNLKAIEIKCGLRKASHETLVEVEKNSEKSEKSEKSMKSILKVSQGNVGEMPFETEEDEEDEEFDEIEEEGDFESEGEEEEFMDHVEDIDARSSAKGGKKKKKKSTVQEKQDSNEKDDGQRKKSDAEIPTETRKSSEAATTVQNQTEAEAKPEEPEIVQADAENAEEKQKQTEADIEEQQKKQAEAEIEEQQKKQAEAEIEEQKKKQAEAEIEEEKRKQAEAESAEQTKKLPSRQPSFVNLQKSEQSVYISEAPSMTSTVYEPKQRTKAPLPAVGSASTQYTLMDSVHFTPSGHRRKKKKGVTRRIENRFIEVGMLASGGIFGLGEKMEDRVIMAQTTVQCLMLPRYWLFEKEQNPGNCWKRKRIYLDSTIPSRQALFDDFLLTRKWQKFKDDLIASCVDDDKGTNPTKYQDIPIMCHILESEDK